MHRSQRVETITSICLKHRKVGKHGTNDALSVVCDAAGRVVHAFAIRSLCLLSTHCGHSGLARPEGLEPPTSGFEARRSIQLSQERLLGH